MEEVGLKVRVGALVLLALGALAGFVMVLGNFSLGPRHRLYVELADSGSLLAGAPVKIAGVRAGRVERVEFLVAGDGRTTARGPVNVRLTAAIDPDMAPAVRQDSIFVVTSQGVLGEKYLEIVPGSPGAPMWPADSHVRGVDPPRLDVLFGRMDQILAQVEGALTGEGGLPIGELVARLGRLAKTLDDLLTQERGRIGRVLGHTERAVEEAAGLLGSLRGAVGDGEAVAAILADGRATAADARRLAATAAGAAGPLTAGARRVLDRGERLMGEVEGVVTESRPGLRSALSRLDALLTLATNAVRDVAWITERLRGGQGVVGQLLNDPEIYDDLKEMLRDLKRNPWKFLWKE